MPALRQCLGIDLGTHSVKIVEVAVEKNAIRVIRAASAPTGVMPSMSAEEVRAAIVSTAKEVLKKNRFSSRKAVYGVSGQKVFVRRFRLPKTSEERLARIIQYEARQQIPFPLDKTLIQWQHRNLDKEGEVEVLLVAIRIDEIRDYMGMVGKIGIAPVAIGVSTFALFNAHRLSGLNPGQAELLFDKLNNRKKKAPSKKAEAAPTAVNSSDKTMKLDVEDMPQDDFSYSELKGYVNIGAATFDVAIPRGDAGSGMVGFTRTVPLAGDEMTKAVMRGVGVESFHDAERIKTSATQLMSFNFDFEAEHEVNQEASMAVTEVADKMITEIRKSLEFYITQPDGVAIDSVVVTGGQALLPGIDAYLEEKLALPVSVVKELPEGSPLHWPQTAGVPTQYFVATGLALQGVGAAEIKVDFLPEDQKITRDFPYRVTAVMAGIVLLIIAVSSQAGKNYSAVYLRDTESLNKQADALREKAKAFDETQALHITVADDYDKLAKTFGQRTYWTDFLAALANIKPPGVVITNIAMNHDGRVEITAVSELAVAAADFNDAVKSNLASRLAETTEEDGNKVTTRILSIQTMPPRPPFEKEYSQFRIAFQLNDKVNHLNIVPTLAVTPTPGPPRPAGRP